MPGRSGIILSVLAALAVSGCAERPLGPGSKAGQVAVNRADGARMVWVPAGEFAMGSTAEDVARLVRVNPRLNAESLACEMPRRKVYLDGYWIYRTEVTVAQYRRFCEATDRPMPNPPDWGWKDNHPVVNVSWDDAAAYAAWAGGSLPTEAQWEKAARGTDARAYPWGEDWPPKARVANLPDAALASRAPELAQWNDLGYPVVKGYDDGFAQAAPAGSFRAGASPYGCRDMAGNVWEWCADRYSATCYAKAPLKNPPGPSTGGMRVLRGGSWLNDDDGPFRCANRDHFYPDYRHFTYGFRCVRNP